MNIEEILTIDDITAYSKLLYIALVLDENLRSEGNGTIARRLGTNSVTISRSIRQLRDRELINVVYSDNELSKKIEIL